jgi:transcriptional regulator of met regulon
VKDKETARKKFYQDLNEQIRLHAPVKILEIVDSVKTEAELINTVNKIEGEVNIEITLDLFTQAIIDDLMMLEEIEVHQTAEVPEEWKKEINHDYPMN